MRMVLFVEPFHVRQFFQAGRAVGCPEIDQQNLSPVAGEIDALFGDVQCGNGRCGFIDQSQLGNLVFTKVSDLWIQGKSSRRVTVNVSGQ